MKVYFWKTLSYTTLVSFRVYLQKTVFRVTEVTSLVIFGSCGTDESFLKNCVKDLRFVSHFATFFEFEKNSFDHSFFKSFLASKNRFCKLKGFFRVFRNHERFTRRKNILVSFLMFQVKENWFSSPICISSSMGTSDGQLNKNKPLGPSDIPAWALKDCLNLLAEPLCFMINAFIEDGKFPEHLKQAYVIPIFKKGDNEDPDNYRPISITSSIAKVFEQILREQMNEYLERNKLLGPMQFGFRAKYSTTDALLFATEHIRTDLDANRSTAAAFLDLSKAFNSMSHEILLKKCINSILMKSQSK